VDALFLIASWTVTPERRDELVRALSQLLGGVVAKQPGFVAAGLFEGSDGHSVIVRVQMRTVEDRQRLEQLPELRSALRELRRIAQSHDQRYRLLESFGDTDSA
jgi:heme-degrading monooxygenase HmoA